MRHFEKIETTYKNKPEIIYTIYILISYNVLYKRKGGFEKND